MITTWYSYEWMPAPYRSEWERSKQKLTTMEEAASEAAKWLAVNFENSRPVCVRLCRTDVEE